MQQLRLSAFLQRTSDMEKQRAIVDTCFLQKIAAEGRYPDNICKIIDNSIYTPVAHKYVVEQEFVLHS